MVKKMVENAKANFTPTKGTVETLIKGAAVGAAAYGGFLGIRMLVGEPTSYLETAGHMAVAGVAGGIGLLITDKAILIAQNAYLRRKLEAAQAAPAAEAAQA